MKTASPKPANATKNYTAPPPRGVADWRTQAARLTTTVNALNEANEALDTKANAALALSLLAATVSIIALKRR